MNHLKKTISRSILNFRGWKTNRKIVVIESDDWGSIRMPSKEVYDKCLKAGYPVDKSAFAKNDCLESNDDMELLFETLLSIKDNSGNHPIITANVLMANPNFKKIKESNYEQYFYENVIETFKRYPKHNKVFDYWNKGLQLKIFKPQLHGREHLNVSRFMNDLQCFNEEARFACENEMPGIKSKNLKIKDNIYVRGMEFHDISDLNEKIKIVKESAELFKSNFGFYSKSFIAQNYIWHPKIEEELNDFEVSFIQSSLVQKIPIGNYEGFKKLTHFTGQINSFGQTYTIRNAYFEPSIFPNRDNINECLDQIKFSFMWKKPAIICMHRINFSGFINQENREKNLKLLVILLKEIIKKWPEVEFFSSDNLGDLIIKDIKN